MLSSISREFAEGMGVTQYFWSLPARKTKKRSEPFIVSEMEFTRLEIKGSGEGPSLSWNNKRETAQCGKSRIS